MFDLEASYREVVEMFPKSARVQISEVRRFGKSTYGDNGEAAALVGYLIEARCNGEVFTEGFGPEYKNARTAKDAAAVILNKIEAIRKQWAEPVAA